MVMSTQTLAESSRLLSLLLMDQVQIMDVSEPVTVGFEVTHVLTPVGDPVDSLVQTVTIENTVEGTVSQAWSVKFRQGTSVEEGQAVKVLRCVQEPSLVGKVLLLDSVSQNGAAMLRKAVAQTFTKVNQEGKEGLS